MSKDFSKIFSSLQHGLATENDLVIENIKQKVWSDLRATLPHPLTSISQNFIETHSLQFDDVASSLIYRDKGFIVSNSSLLLSSSNE